jgi:ADP-ribosylglycohydrolase
LPAYSFDISCQGTVPEAVIAFLEADSYEDAVRNAISLGGDSDTLACITGAIAEAVLWTSCSADPGKS